jgi:GDP-L-fucose synthase
VAGGNTLTGAALLRRLGADGCHRIVGAPPDEPDPADAGQLEDFFAEAQPEYVFVAAGKSGGIEANRQRPAELMHHNLLVTLNLLHAAHEHRVTKLLYLGSSCSYPLQAKQPYRVEDLMTGPVEPTSAAYATAHLAGLALCRAYRQQHGVCFVSAIPANTFGPGDDFDGDTSHVIPALIHKMHQAKIDGQAKVTLWGSGTPRREFLYADDLADACLFAMAHHDAPEPINLGSGIDLSIAEVAGIVAEVVGFRGAICFDSTRPDGAPMKTLDSRPLRALGWKPRAAFRTAIESTYAWYLERAAGVCSQSQRG